MFKQCEINRWDTISLHDCRITHVKRHQQTITLIFSEGFWLTEAHPLNASGKMAATDKAQIVLKQASFDGIMLKNSESFSDELTTEGFINKITSSEWEFEVIDEIHERNNQVVYVGWIWFDREPFHVDCEIRFSFEEMEYCWNELAQENPI